MEGTASGVDWGADKETRAGGEVLGGQKYLMTVSQIGKFGMVPENLAPKNRYKITYTKPINMISAWSGLGQTGGDN